MQVNHKNVVSLLEYVDIDRFNVTCHFKCEHSNKSIVSIVPFEPCRARVELSWLEMLLHPFKSYESYHNRPITIYSDEDHESIIIKAFLKVSPHFIWNNKKKKFIYSNS
ncbi:hypothetical protein GJV85_07615 [Sulfurimonas aquatica]|uniref:Uncharacterized protein n=1 Tax=Sulfurimonas aquatica TaxID=2672570 RepID=A0A975B0N7_9BACT|nr:hypothetical protein [Sulfurimonas aquatica]QSZ41980.1 hypothetical protein GJV85_07615 [Sulfurimonas aquatica]